MTPDQLKVRLTARDIARVHEAAAPLPEADRDAFMMDVAEALTDAPEIGPGILGRIVAEVQRRFITNDGHGVSSGCLL